MMRYRLSHVTRVLSVRELGMVDRALHSGRLASPWTPLCPCGNHTYPGWEMRRVKS